VAHELTEETLRGGGLAFDRFDRAVDSLRAAHREPADLVVVDDRHDDVALDAAEAVRVRVRGVADALDQLAEGGLVDGQLLLREVGDVDVAIVDRHVAKDEARRRLLSDLAREAAKPACDAMPVARDVHVSPRARGR